MLKCNFERSLWISGQVLIIKMRYKKELSDEEVEILQENGSRISEFTYVSHTVTDGKPKLSGLPATYTENDEEAQTLCVKLKDEVTGIVLELLYTIFAQGGIITRSARFTNEGTSLVHLLKCNESQP